MVFRDKVWSLQVKVLKFVMLCGEGICVSDWKCSRYYSLGKIAHLSIGENCCIWENYGVYIIVSLNELLRCCRLSGSTSFASTAQFFVHVACGACSWNLCDTNRFHSLISFALLSLATSLHICSSKQSSLLLADSWVLSEYSVSDVE
jgi:hypothetical protein